MAKSTLNPHAQAFYPPSHASLNASTSFSEKQQGADDVFDLCRLPAEMLACVVSGLADTTDLVHCLLAHPQLRAAMQAAHVTYKLTEHLKHMLSNPSNARMRLDQLVKAVTKYMQGMVACDMSMLPLEQSHISSLAEGLPHLTVLNLSGCKKLQPGVTQILQQPGVLPRLQCLSLQRCFQLTSVCLSDVICQSAGITNGGGALQCIALSHLNLSGWPPTANPGPSSSSTAADSTGSDCGNSSASAAAVFWQQLQQVVRAALLHVPRRLDLLQLLPHARAAVPAGGISSASSSLRVVVLNNCSHLSVEGLISLAAACPQLEYLMLGGSTLKASWETSGSGTLAAGGTAPGQGTDAQAAGAAAAAGGVGANGDAEGPAAAAAGAYVPRHVAAAAAAAAAAGGAGSSSAQAAVSGGTGLPAALQQLAALLQLPAVLPWEVLSTCCTQEGGQHCGHKACSCCSSEPASAGAGADRAAAAASRASRARRQLQRNEPSAAAVETARSHALALAYAAALLPRLKAIEVTFMGPGVAGWLRVAVQRLQQLQGKSHSFSSSSSGGAGLYNVAGWQEPNGLYRSSSASSHTSAMVEDYDTTPAVAPAAAAAVLCAEEEDSIGSSSSCCYPKVWEFSCITAVHDALQTLQQCRSSSRQGGSCTEGLAPLSTSCLATAVCCAVNCSNRGRSTPLHLAAERGCARHISALLQAGAAAAARDASGASPLFVAAEAGQAAAVAVLLGAGADPLVGNTAGETALYIAALRGHLPVVELLLAHLSAAGVDWMASGLYGDAWTPLMAAAVANRVDVALCLLRAATGFSRAGLQAQQQPTGGSSSKVSSYPSRCQNAQRGRSSESSGGSSSSSSSSSRWNGGAGVERLLAAENRYGQTALHIAARKGCRELLQLLLLYGAGQVVDHLDAAGDTPWDVARRHGHHVALRELLQRC